MKKLILLLVVIMVALFLIKKNNMTWRQSILKAVYPLLMQTNKWFSGKQTIQLNEGRIIPTEDFYSLTATGNDGKPIDFHQFRGKKVLIVNTASDCGYTGQYEELENLYRERKSGLVILGFPANDFKGQEKKDDNGIAEFCKINYGVTFPLVKKSQVIKGAAQNEVFGWLSNAKRNGWCNRQPVWNFTKYLVDEQGVLKGFYGPAVSPLSKELVAAL